MLGRFGVLKSMHVCINDVNEIDLFFAFFNALCVVVCFRLLLPIFGMCFSLSGKIFV